MSATPSSEPEQLQRGERVAIADDVDTNAERLSELAKDPSWRVRRAVAGNPSTPPAVLIALATDEASRVRIRLAANPATPSEALSILAFDASEIVRGRVSNHSATDPTALVRSVLRLDRDAFIDRIQTMYDRSGDDLYRDERILERVDRLEHRQLFRLARSPRTPAPILERMSAMGDRQLAAPLVANPNITPAALDLIADDAASARLVAAHPLAGPELLRRLVNRHGRTAVSAIVAGNPNLGVDLQRQLASSRSWHVRAALAANPEASPAIVNELATDREWAVRHQVAASPHLSHATSRRLIGDRAPVRLQLAANPSTAPDVHDQLTGDAEEWVRGVALRHAHDSIALRRAVDGLDGPGWILKGVANNPAAPQDLVDEIGAWLVLGGGTGDPDFDPVTCTGRPPGDRDGEVLITAAYRALAGDRPIEDPHPLALARCYQGSEKSPSAREVGFALADPDPRVRIAVLNRVRDARRDLLARVISDDPDPAAVRTAVRIRQQAERSAAFGQRSLVAQAGLIVAVCLLVVFAAVVASTVGSNDAAVTAYDGFQITSITSISLPPPDPLANASTDAGGRISLGLIGVVQLVLQTVAGEETLEITGVRIVWSEDLVVDRPRFMRSSLQDELQQELPLTLGPGEVSLIELVGPWGMEALVIDYVEAGSVNSVELVVPWPYTSPNLSTTTTTTIRSGS